MTIRKRALSVFAATLCTVGLAVLPSTPAAAVAAATPQCVKAIDRLDDGPGGANWMPAASNNSTICYLSQGSVSQAVWALQRALKICYGQNIVVDSDFGPNTKAALVNVQRSLRISADGVYGVQTRTAMKFSRAGLSEPDASNPIYCHHNSPVT
ncbi:peptidoglycan-binding protein [Streptomyces sp. NPDC056909]|uniref:peptidoglycan-binding domain-containing protein n=1 Tax=Streptomyces sp. NPDC056909 TaxID=3345963 RepID=UPI0036B4C857